MNRRINDLIPIALEAAEKYLENLGEIASEYHGYISSFGAAVIQSGLKPAIAFYEREGSSSLEDKKKLMSAILYMIKNKYASTPNEADDNRSLLAFVLQRSDIERRVKRDIVDASITLKLAIRTFKIKKRGELNDG